MQHTQCITYYIYKSVDYIMTVGQHNLINNILCKYILLYLVINKMWNSKEVPVLVHEQIALFQSNQDGILRMT